MTGVLKENIVYPDETTVEKKGDIDKKTSETTDICGTEINEPNGEEMKDTETLLEEREETVKHESPGTDKESNKDSFKDNMKIVPKSNTNKTDISRPIFHEKTTTDKNQENDVMTPGGVGESSEKIQVAGVPEKESGFKDKNNNDNSLDSDNLEDRDSDKSTSSTEEGLSEYELLRLRKIKRNQERMKQLGLFNISQKMIQTRNETTPTPKKVKKPTVQVPTPRTLPRRKARDFVYSPYISNDEDEVSSSINNKRGNQLKNTAASSNSGTVANKSGPASVPVRNRKMYTLSKSMSKKSKVLPKDRKRRQRCLKCAGCVALDCGKCLHCLDKKKFGGPDRLRQACRLKRCEAWYKPEPLMAGNVGLGIYDEVLEFLWGEGRITDNMVCLSAESKKITNSIETVGSEKHPPSNDNSVNNKMIPVIVNSPQMMKPSIAQTHDESKKQNESSSECVVVPNLVKPPTSKDHDNDISEVNDDGYPDDDDGNMEFCQICQQTGVLICCDKCPRSFHPNCIGMAKEDLPRDYWECRFCQDDVIAKQHEHMLGEKSFGIVNIAFSSINKADHADLVYSKMLIVSKIHELIQYLMKFDFGNTFSKPVVNVPGYRKIVKQPMDLGTIEKRILNGVYYRDAIRAIEVNDSIDINEINTRDKKELFGVIDLVILEILKSIEIIWHNCFLFNSVESVYYKMGQVQRRKYIAILTSSFYSSLDSFVVQKLTEFVSECRLFEKEELEREKELNRLEEEKNVMKLENLALPAKETKIHLKQKKRNYRKSKLAMPRKRHVVKKQAFDANSGSDYGNSRNEPNSEESNALDASPLSNDVEHKHRNKNNFSCIEDDGIISTSNLTGESNYVKKKDEIVSSSISNNVNPGRKKKRHKKRKRKRNDADAEKTSVSDPALKTRKPKKKKKKKNTSQGNSNVIQSESSQVKSIDSKSGTKIVADSICAIDNKSHPVQRKISRKELVAKARGKRGRPRKRPSDNILDNEAPKRRGRPRKYPIENTPNGEAPKRRGRPRKYIDENEHKSINNDMTETPNQMLAKNFVFSKEKYDILGFSRKQILKTLTPNYLKPKKGSKVLDIVLANVHKIDVTTKQPRTIILNKKGLIHEPKKIQPVGNELENIYQCLKKKLDSCSKRNDRKRMLDGCFTDLIIPSSIYENALH